MSSTKESKIEDFAFDYLQHYYALQQSAKSVLISKSDKTKNGAEVDGLFAFKDRDSSIFVATVSFKDAFPLADILINYKKNGLSKVRYITPAVLLITSFLVAAQSDHWLYMWVAPFLVAISGFYIHSFSEKNYLKRKIRQQVDALRQHKANEKWLGISISSLCFRNNSLASYLLKQCQRQGVGLITVGKRAKVVLMQEPRTQISRRGDYLRHFSAENSIRQALSNETVLRVA
ncbi:hypothetical protein ACSX1A_12745 [Pontibacter sp. MBLB2868]|uniref:hypothetical protein n=1 Tax=Pontibacter sp. MBLB2868 TaxID=3451555 RepID=UPI003F74D002